MDIEIWIPWKQGYHCPGKIMSQGYNYCKDRGIQTGQVLNTVYNLMIAGF